MQKPKLLIITGPQGSGNHLFSKVFSKHPRVYGWDMKSYWEGHHEEPFNEYWRDPSKLKDFPWEEHDFIFTSVSCPYIKEKVPHIPKYKSFIETAMNFADVKIGIIGRDSNILKLQQERVRGRSTLKFFQQSLDYLIQFNPTFISQELYQLYGNYYLHSLSIELGFPILPQDISEDANAKYITSVDEQPLDLEVKRVSNES